MRRVAERVNPTGAVSLWVVSESSGTRARITAEPIDVAEIIAWCGTTASGAVDTFCGIVRDHADGRTGITRLDYEAHPTGAEPRLARVAATARRRWPVIERIALIHRVGSLSVGDVAVVVAVSTPHRPEAFDATRWCIDALKATVPIWKYEYWDGGEGWGTCAQRLVELDEWDPTARDPVAV